MAMTRPTARLAVRASCVLLLAAACCGLARGDTYKWVDAAGRTHYSDVPPQDGSHAETLGNVPKPVPAESTSPAVGADKNAKEAKDAKDADAKAATLRGRVLGVEESDKSPEQLRRRAENCDRARGEMNMLVSEGRVFTVDAKGERQYVDDETRAARIAELQRLIAADCK